MRRKKCLRKMRILSRQNSDCLSASAAYITPSDRPFGRQTKQGEIMDKVLDADTGTEQKPFDMLVSRFVNVEDLLWKPTPTKGIDMKVLMHHPESGLMTALVRWEPGAVIPRHEHVEIEQTYVLQGSILDEEGEVLAGNYVWRPRGHSHIASAPKGALVLSFFIKPNRFLEGDLAGVELK
jgi:quercetin dioxygenase-like cupin family protein